MRGPSAASHAVRWALFELGLLPVRNRKIGAATSLDCTSCPRLAEEEGTHAGRSKPMSSGLGWGAPASFPAAFAVAVLPP